ncbi:ATP-binding protein [Haemophilus influenzae]|uniref:ATP-binding protein n=1 Tax=Haemophilus influenzae TaxID=727 RepID=UPI0006812EBF|nr:ATP-binding protein [Haemophilus influenzae]KMZ33163.1 hypothetical protein ABN30_02075 [Haemophilus influenzae]MCK8932856.1 ATP-binding protein [Haemophilus influenzae]PRI99891.1 Archaeal ATPase [Haemophilus influenzae]PRL86824.1 Archaeal ATPase [Haemophilus influenzae]RFO65746.1 hypothetical protein CH569_09300 [Haemophilus influenzae]
MKFLNIRHEKTPRKDGTKYAKLYFESKSKKFGKVESSKYIGNRKNILISGGFHSGKTRMIMKIWKERQNIWGKDRGFVKLSGFGTIAEYVDTPQLRDFFNAIPKNKKYKDNRDLQEFWASFEGREFKQLKQHERIENLIEFIKHHNTVLIIDDAQKLTNRKLEIVKRAIEHCKQFVIATSEEQRLSTSLRTVVLNSNLEHLKLDTQASYDATSIFVYFLIACCAAGGWYELAFIMGGLKALSSGRRASRKD